MTPSSARAAPALALAPLHAATALGLLLGLQPLLTDLYLPALPLIVREFGAPMGAVQMTMSGLILAFGLMQLVWGPVADRFGRRPVLIASLALMALASLGAASASSMGWLVFWRIAQGATLAAGVVCARAMVRDLYEPHQGAQVMALALSGLGLIAIVVPIAGGVIASLAGWRTGLLAVAACTASVWLYVLLRVPETLRVPDPQALRLPVLVRNAARTLAHPTFRAWALLVAGTYSGLFILLSATSYVYIGQLGMTSWQYGLTMAGGSGVYLIGTLVCRRWLTRHGLPRTAARGAPFTLAGGLLMAGCGLLFAQPPLTLVLLAHGLFTFGHGIHQPCGQTGAVGPFPHAAGVASALAGCLLAFVAFLTGGWLGSAMDGTLRPIGIGLGVAATATALIAWTLVQRDGEPRR
jgi:MFS transporter, DHA1 family, multidrug resistance protein